MSSWGMMPSFISAVQTHLVSLEEKHSIFERCKRLLRTNRIIQILAGITGFAISRKIIFEIYRKWNKLPPGPIGLPFFGTHFRFDNDSLYPMKLTKKYGPIVYTSMIGTSFIILGDAGLVKQLLTQKEYLGRGSAFQCQGSWLGTFTVGTDPNKEQAYPLFDSGDKWVKRRKYTTSVTELYVIYMLCSLYLYILIPYNLSILPCLYIIHVLFGVIPNNE